MFQQPKEFAKRGHTCPTAAYIGDNFGPSAKERPYARQQRPSAAIPSLGMSLCSRVRRVRTGIKLYIVGKLSLVSHPPQWAASSGIGLCIFPCKPIATARKMSGSPRHALTQCSRSPPRRYVLLPETRTGRCLANAACDGNEPLSIRLHLGPDDPLK